MRLAILALCLLITPTVATAAPVIPAIIAFVVAYGQYIVMAGMLLYGNSQSKKAEKDAARAAEQQKNEYNAGLRDRRITDIATESPYTYVYGQARVGGSIVALFSSGAKDEYKHMVCVHAAHECEELGDVYINGVDVGALDVNGDVTGGKFLKVETFNTTENFSVSAIDPTAVNLGHVPEDGTVKVIGRRFDANTGNESRKATWPHSRVGNVVTIFPPTDAVGSAIQITYEYKVRTPMLRVRKHLGTPDDPADAFLMSTFPTKWKDTAVLRGFAYTVIRLNLYQPEFQGGVPDIEVVIKGKKLYDYRTDTTAWSANPALITYDYLTGELCGVSGDDIPMDDFITAANVCDEEFSFGKRYTVNGTVTSGQAQAQILEQLALSMAGSISSTTWGMRAGIYTAPIMTINQEDIIGSIAVTPGMSDSDTFNGVKGQFISPDNKYVLTDYKPYQNQTFLEVDGREVWSSIDFPFTDSLQRVHNLCRIFTEKNRNAYTVKADFNLKTWKLHIGDRVLVNSEHFGWTNKIFEVTDKRYSPSSAVELSLKEDAPSIWDFADQTVNDATPNTDLPDPFIITPLAFLSCESGTDILQIATTGEITSRILATWPAPAAQTAAAVGNVEIEWKAIGETSWERISVSAAQNKVYLSPVIDAEFYNIRARIVDPYFNTASDWTYAVLHQVIGKTAPPENIQDFNISGDILTWTPVTDVDLRGYIFRFQYGTNLDWNSATPLHQGVITDTPYNLLTRPSGAVTIMGKAVDTSSNESLSTANIFTDLGDAPIQNIVEEINLDSLGYPGTIEGGSLVSGDLLANGLDSFYGTNSQSFYTSGLDSFYEDSTYDQIVYTTDIISIGSVLAGSIMTVVYETTGTDLAIEYRYPDSTPFYSLDSESFYGVDPDPFYAGIQGAWIAWPGQVFAKNDAFQFRIKLGAGAVRGTISEFSIIIDAPDIVEGIDDVLIDAAGTNIPYTKVFNVIKNVQATLQSNGSGAETIEVDKTINLAPKIKAYNSSHTAVSGATSDITIRGY